jgi:hypothetical protein
MERQRAKGNGDMFDDPMRTHSPAEGNRGSRDCCSRRRPEFTICSPCPSARYAAAYDSFGNPVSTGEPIVIASDVTFQDGTFMTSISMRRKSWATVNFVRPLRHVRVKDPARTLLFDNENKAQLQHVEFDAGRIFILSDTTPQHWTSIGDASHAEGLDEPFFLQNRDQSRKQCRLQSGTVRS